MLAQPTFMQPYSDAIDVESPINRISCQINSGKIIAYKIDIYHSSNVMAYSTGKITDDGQLPIYGNKGDASYLFVDLPSDIGLVNGKDYKWVLTQWEELDSSHPSPSVWVSYGKVYSTSSQVNTSSVVYTRPHTNVSDGMYLQVNGETRLISSYTLDTSPVPLWGRAQLATPLSATPDANIDYKIVKDWIDNAEYGYPFYARTTPELTIDEFGTIVNSETIIDSSYMKVHAVYSQAEGVPLKSYRFQLHSSDGSLIKDTEEVYCLDIEFEYDGYLSGQEYTLTLTAENQMGVKVESAVVFKAQYELAVIPISPIATFDNNEYCTVIDFSNATSILGKSNGSLGNGYEFNESGISLDEGYYVFWDELNGVGDLDIPDEFTVIVKTALHEGFERTPLEIEHDSGYKYTVRYDGVNFYYKINNGAEHTYFPYETIVSASSSSLDMDALYIWDDSDIWNDSESWFDNDIANSYYWYIVCRPNDVKFVKGELAI